MSVAVSICCLFVFFFIVFFLSIRTILEKNHQAYLSALTVTVSVSLVDCKICQRVETNRAIYLRGAHIVRVAGQKFQSYDLTITQLCKQCVMNVSDKHCPHWKMLERRSAWRNWLRVMSLKRTLWNQLSTEMLDSLFG